MVRPGGSSRISPLVNTRVSIPSPPWRRNFTSRRTLAEEKERPGRVLFPIRVDDAVMDTTEQWAHDIKRTRHIGDFSRWKDHDAYQKAFDRLLRDLRIETPPP